MATAHLVGVDGGASKTRAVLLDLDGRIRATAATGPCRVGPRPSAEACATLSAIVDELCRQAGLARSQLTVVSAGLCGVDFEDEHPVQHAVLAAALELPSEKLLLVNDGIAALWGATAAPAAAILQHGTGLTMVYRRRHGEEQLFDVLDIGLIFDLRREVVARVARMIDGRLAGTMLKDQVLEVLGVSEVEFAGAIYRRRVPHERLLQLAPVVFAGWSAGDPAACALVEVAAQDYLTTAAAMIQRCGPGPVELALGGGLLAHAPVAFMTELRRRLADLHPEVGLIAPRLSPELGAAILGAFRAGADPVALFQRLSTKVETT